MFSKCWCTSSGTGSWRASSRAHRSSAAISLQMGDLGGRGREGGEGERGGREEGGGRGEGGGGRGGEE